MSCVSKSHILLFSFLVLLHCDTLLRVVIFVKNKLSSPGSSSFISILVLTKISTEWMLRVGQWCSPRPPPPSSCCCCALWWFSCSCPNNIQHRHCCGCSFAFSAAGGVPTDRTRQMLRCTKNNTTVAVSSFERLFLQRVHCVQRLPSQPSYGLNQIAIACPNTRHC